MSGNVRNRAQGGNPQNTNQGQAPVFRAKAKPKISPIAGGNFDYSGDPRVGESFVVVVAGPDRIKSITFHHPIGKTDLADRDWVATNTSDVADLVARREDPQEATLRTNRENHRFDAAIAGGLLLKGADNIVRYPSGIERQTTLAAARAAAKAQARQAGNKPTAMAYLAHLSAERRVEEDAVRVFLTRDDIVGASVTAFPDSTYRTRSGPLGNRDQTALTYLNGMNRAQAEDTVVQQLFD